MKTAALIVAGGRGLRAGGTSSGSPKQYRHVGGRPVLSWSLGAFVAHTAVDAVIAVIHPDDRQAYKAASTEGSHALLPPIFGGETRQQSVHAGLKALASHAPRDVLIHDAVRPFVSQKLIGRVIEKLAKFEGALPALPITDTLKRCLDGQIAETVDRRDLWAAQTPQGFRFEKICAAHAAAAGETRDFTDDASIAEWHGVSVARVDGEQDNRKLTTEEDFDLASRKLQAQSSAPPGEWRTGHGFDTHCFTSGDHVMLCGVRVPHLQALHGHSDADVGLHALTDALLGAIGDGDIGSHFPPSDPQWRDASSDLFLREAAARVGARGGRISNADVTLICEAPKIAPYRDAMRERVAEILRVEIDRVSIKATTTEGLGYTGRSEGIAAQATASIWLP